MLQDYDCGSVGSGIGLIWVGSALRTGDLIKNSTLHISEPEALTLTQNLQTVTPQTATAHYT